MKTKFTPEDMKELFEQYKIKPQDTKLIGHKDKEVFGIGVKQ